MVLTPHPRVLLSRMATLKDQKRVAEHEQGLGVLVGVLLVSLAFSLLVSICTTVECQCGAIRSIFLVPFLFGLCDQAHMCVGTHGEFVRFASTRTDFRSPLEQTTFIHSPGVSKTHHVAHAFRTTGKDTEQEKATWQDLATKRNHDFLF